jgi:hypothetical protein
MHENTILFTNYDIRTYISQNQMKMRLVSVLRMMVLPRCFFFDTKYSFLTFWSWMKLDNNLLVVSKFEHMKKLGGFV